MVLFLLILYFLMFCKYAAYQYSVSLCNMKSTLTVPIQGMYNSYTSKGQLTLAHCYRVTHINATEYAAVLFLVSEKQHAQHICVLHF